MTPKEQQPTWVCRECGGETRSWRGKCPNCGAWNTLQEFRFRPTRGPGKQKAERLAPVRIDDLPDPDEIASRISTGSAEFDRVLGGGLVRSATLLLAGEPGVGKSTLLLQVAHQISSQGEPVLYISGEESVEQIQRRSHRLHREKVGKFEVVAANDVEAILDLIETTPPRFIILDSIQTVSDDAYPSVAGSVVQVRQVAARLSQWTKEHAAILLLVGHVTKTGNLAGPRTLEHLVDVVLALEGHRYQNLRILRAQKNRYGPTDEIGLMSMESRGIEDLQNPQQTFLKEQRQVPGSATAIILEGQRALPIDVEALVRPTRLPYPKRLSNGIPSSRLELVIAVLEAHAAVAFGADDCFVSVAGGMKLRDPGLDLAIAAALVSAKYRRALPPRAALFGELGLTGSLREVHGSKKRHEEATRLGFQILSSARTIAAALVDLGLTKKP